MLTNNQEKPFVVLMESGAIYTATHSEVSRMYDLSDFDHMDGVKAVYAVSQECELVPVTLGELVRDPDYPDGGTSIVYARSAILAGTRRVGTVHWTDH